MQTTDDTATTRAHGDDTTVSPQARVAASAQLKPGVVVEAGAHVMEDFYLGRRTRVERNAVIASGTFIDHDTRTGEAARIRRKCRLGYCVRVGRRAQVGGGAIMLDCASAYDDARIAALVRLDKDARVEAGAEVGTGARIGRLVCVPAGTKVEAHAVVPERSLR